MAEQETGPIALITAIRYLNTNQHTFDQDGRSGRRLFMKNQRERQIETIPAQHECRQGFRLIRHRFRWPQLPSSTLQLRQAPRIATPDTNLWLAACGLLGDEHWDGERPRLLV